MKWRAIVRFSFDKDKNSRVRNEVLSKLTDCGFRKTRTGQWETAEGDPKCISKTLSMVFNELASLSKNPFDEFSLDHIWVFIDKVNISKVRSQTPRKGPKQQTNESL